MNYSASSDLFTVRDVTLVTVKLSPGTKPRAAVDAFKRLGTVKWAQVNYTYAGDRRELSPSDPQYANQYHHPLMQNNLAWDITQGDPRVVVAITDDGVDAEHEDLYRNIWVNQAEIPALRRASLTDVNGDGYISMDELNDPANRGAFKANDVNADGRITAADLLAPMVKDGGGNDTGAGGWTDGIDEGNNGYADDITGRDFWGNDNDQREEGFDTHGTHVTGIAAARTDNGVGVAGTAGRITVMPIRFWASAGNIWTSTIVSNAYRYAADNGAKILSTSYNIDGFVSDNIFVSAVQYMYDHGVLHFNSAGNSGAQDPLRQKLDQSLYVVNTDSLDHRSSSSNFGWGVDISAPGTGILSTFPNNTYGLNSGTSMATPNAAAVAALIWSAHPSWTREQVAAQLLGTTDNIDALNPGFAGQLGDGRVNSFKALGATVAPPRIRSILGLPAQNGSTSFKPTTFNIDVANVFDPATINLSAFELRGDGGDNLFGTADDVVVPMTLTFGGSSASTFMVGTNRLNFTIPGAMAPDTYRLSILPSAKDPFGQSIDGNGDGTAGDAFTRTFTLAAFSNAYRVSVNVGQDFANVHFGNHDVITPKVLASSFNFATSHSLAFQFSEDISSSLSLADLTLTNLTTGQPVNTGGFTYAYNAADNTATFLVNAILPDADYRATLGAAGITDPSGNQLDGDGNAAGGDNYDLGFFFMQGDINHDRAVNLLDFNMLAGNFGQSSKDFTQGDLNYDGTVNLNDFNILASRFGQTLPSRTFSATALGEGSSNRVIDDVLT